MSPKYVPRTLVAVVLLAVLPAPALRALDSWVRVGSGGLGNPARVQPDAVAVHAGFVWVASADPLPGGGKRPRLFRAAVTDDTRWTEITPPWTGNGEVTDLEPFGGDLYVATSFGQVWRFRRGVWANATPAWPGTAPVHDLASWPPTLGPALLCAVRGTAEVRCGLEAGVADALLPVPLFDRSDIGDVTLQSLRDRLYLSVSGSSAGSRTCEVLFYQRTLGWSRVTTDCFGVTERTWASAMAVLGNELYLGTGGHEDLAASRVFRLRFAGGVSDVTPTAIYDCAFGGCPLRYGSMAVAGRQLFAGTRTNYGDDPGQAEVVRTNGTTWSASNESGFGSVDNDTLTALGAQGTLLYAAALNLVTGFEVWRRNFLLVEIIPETHPAWRTLQRELRRLAECLRTGQAQGCPSRELQLERFATMRLAFQTARHPADNLQLVLATRQRFASAQGDLDGGLALAAKADKLAASDPKRARTLYAQAAARLDKSRLACEQAWAALVPKHEPD